MKKLKTFENFNMLNEHAWMPNLDELGDFVKSGKKVLCVVSDHESKVINPTIRKIEIDDLVRRAKQYDVIVLLDNMPAFGWTKDYDLDPIIHNRIAWVAVDDISNIPKLSNIVELGTVGYNL